MVEQPAVNRFVVGSSPTRGAFTSRIKVRTCGQNRESFYVFLSQICIIIAGMLLCIAGDLPMADLPPGVYQDKESGNFRISVRLGEKQFHRSLDTDDEKKAITMAANIRELIHDLKRGKVEMPAGADPWEFL